MKRKLLLFSLLLALFAPWAAQAQNELTIYESGSATSSYVPIYGLWADAYLKCEFVVPADELAEMNGGIISQMTFYLTTPATDLWSGTFQVFLGEVDDTTIGSFHGSGDATVVYEGQLDGTQSTMTVEFSNNYTYGGSNLLVGVYQIVSGNYKSATFAGASVTGASGSGYSSSSLDAVSFTQRNFVPKTTFTYSPGGGPTCARPDEITAGNVTTNSAVLTWTGGSGVYNIELNGTIIEEGYEGYTYNLTNLTPATNYQARVQSTCGTDPETGDPVTSGWKSVNFRTECGAITTFPWTETFESFASGDFNDPCWVNEHISGGGTSIFKIYTSTMSGNSTHMLQLPDMSIGTLTKLVLPEMNLPGDNYQFVINVYRSTSTYNDNYPSEGIRVFASTDGNIEGATELAFIPRHYQVSNAVIPAEASDGWYEYELPIGFSGTCYIILRGESQYCTATYMDNFAVQQIPTCPKPRNLAYSDVTGHTANLTWTPGAEGQTQWQICLNGDEENLIPVNSAEGAYTLTGLTGTTPYTAKVRAYCSETDQSPWSNEVSFTTTVTCITPTGLTNSNITNHSATLDWTSDATEWILAYRLYSGTDDDYIEVPVTEKPYILDGLTPETRYIVRVRANCGEEDGLSAWSSTTNFTILEAYPAPVNVVCDSVFAYSAFFSWTERGDAVDWEVAYKLATDPDDAYIFEPTPDNHPFELGIFEPLLPGTDYVFKVRSAYFTADGDTTSAWSAVVPFTTLQTCPAPTEVVVYDSTINAYGATLDWHSVYSDSWNVKYRTPAYMIGTEEHFNTNSAPQGWTRYSALLSDVLNGGSLGSTTTSGWMFTNTNVFGQYHAKLNIYGTYKYWLVSPELTLADGPAMSFDLALTVYNSTGAASGTCEDDKFVVLIYANDTWTILREWNNSGSEDVYNTIATAGENVSIDLSAYQGQTVQIAFYGESTVSGNGDNDLHIDNVLIGTPVAATEWTEVAADAVPFELTGLNPETYYEVVVTSNCGDETSEESASVFFTTRPSCQAPTELVVDNENVTAHAATLSWTENGSATEWVIEYTAIIDGEAVAQTINVTENPYTLTGLLAETPYAVKVKAFCGQGDESQWSNTARFTTTVACPAPTELAVDEESLTTTGATLSWNGTSDSYTLMIGEPDPENLVEGTMLNVNFNDQVIPSTWTNSASYSWAIVDGHMQSGNAGVSSSSSSISFTMTFDSNVTIEFDAECMGEGTSTYYDHCDFTIDGTTQFSNGANISGWNHYTYNVAAGEHTFTWSYTKDSSVNPTGDYFAVDNIKITGLVPTPSSWVEYTAEDATYTFDNLTPGTSYMVYVIGNCEGEGQSQPSGTISFTTVATCVVPTDLAATDVTAHTATLEWNGENDSYVVKYRIAAGTQDWINVDFENGLPAGWTSEGAATWSVGTGDYTAATGAHGGSYNALITHSTTGNVTYLVSPAIDLSEQSDLTLKLWYVNRSWAGDIDGFGIYYRIDGGAWNEIFATTEAHSGWTEFNQALPAGAYAANCQFGFKYTDEYGYGVGLDDINISVPTAAGEWMTATANDATVVLEGLIGETTYEAMVQAVCTEDDASAFTEPITFTTLVACPAVTELAVSEIEAHSAVLTWVEVGEATAWQICVNGDEENLIDVVANDEGNTLTYTLEGLAQDADITVKVRANCGDEDGNSAWTTISFHTLVACARPTNLAADNIATESVTLTWEGTSDSYVVQLMPWVQVGNDIQATEALTPYTFDLSQYSGVGSIAIRHYAISDMFRLAVDDIVVTNAQGEEIVNEGFESGSIPSSWDNLDLDGDGFDWAAINFGDPIGNGAYVATSDSWVSGYGALTPDNWLIIPDVALGGTLTFYARGVDPAYPQENFGVFVLSEDDLIEETVEGETTVDIWDLTPNTAYVWQVKGVCGEDESQWAGSFFTTLDDLLVFVTDGDWNNAENWDPAQLPTTDNNVRIEANAIIPAGVVAEANRITFDGGSITIKDGGQMKHNSATLKVTMEKEIAGYGEGNGNYYFISTPFTGRTKFTYDDGWSHVLNLTEGEYDFYAYDGNNGEDNEWVNYKAHSEHIAFISEPTSSGSGNPGMDYGRGYLYANEVNDTLNFTGVTTPSINAFMTKGYTYDDINKGWILVGNPYPCNGYLSFVDDEGEMLEANFYVMNAAGDDIELAETANGIAPLTGAFVNFGATGYVRFDSEEPDQAKHTSTGKFVMSLNQDGNAVDKAVVRFGKGLNLEKMSLKNNSKLYFSNNDKDYAVVYTMRQGEMPVNFKAETAGSYTINCAADGVNFKELVLVDNVNNTKVDLLANPSYTFETEAGEFAGRFTIVYRVK